MTPGSQPPAFRRLLQALQNFGQVVPFSILPAAVASFHSAPHFFCRSCMACFAAVCGFFGLVVVAAGVGADCAAALNVVIGSDVAMRPAARTAARSLFGMILSRWFLGTLRATTRSQDITTKDCAGKASQGKDAAGPQATLPSTAATIRCRRRQGWDGRAGAGAWRARRRSGWRRLERRPRER